MPADAARPATWRIRHATVEDTAAMMRIRLAVHENRLSDPNRIGPQDYHEMLTHRGRGWLAIHGAGHALGFAIGDHVERNVWALFVEPESERLGIGQALHDAMMHWLFTMSAARIWLSTDRDTRAEGFYHAHGWRPAGTTQDGEVRFEMTAADWSAYRDR